MPISTWPGTRWRNRRRTLITLASIGFGTMLAVIMTGIQDGQWGAMIDMAARLGGGHVTLQHDEYLETPTISRSISGTGGLKELVFQDTRVDAVVERITGFLMLSTSEQAAGAAFIAYDPGAETLETLSILDAVKEGEVFSDSDEVAIILGRQLAENLNAQLGKKVILTLTDKDSELVREAVRLKGIIHTGAPGIDAGMALLPVGFLRNSVGYEAEEATQLGIFVEDQRHAESVAAAITADLDGLNGEGGTVVAIPWYDAQADLANFIMMKVVGGLVMQVIIAILIAAGIFNTIFVSVMERVREFGVLLAIGFSPNRLFRMIMLESFWLGVVGLAFATLLTVGPYYYLSTTGIDISAVLAAQGQQVEVAGVAMGSTMLAHIYPEKLIFIGLMAVSATLLSGLYPAWKAGRIEPVESIRLV